MTQKELFKLLKRLKIPVAYHHFECAIEPPYLCYFAAGRKDVFADDTEYLKIGDYVIELYTAQKTPTLEETLEKLLEDAGINYDVEETYIDDIKVYAIIYNVQI